MTLAPTLEPPAAANSVPVPREQTVEPGRAPKAATGGGGRIASIDAYRGLVMLLMMGEVLEFGRVSQALPGNAAWAFLAKQQSHVEWVGCNLHDLIQPSFSFLVGVALPFSLARRAADGQPQWMRTAHAFWRALVLVLMGVLLRSIDSDHTNWTFEDTLSQIGLGYGFLYLLALGSWRVQSVALGVILLGYWALFALWPSGGGGELAMAQAGVASDWPHWMQGFAAHWNKNANPASAFDAWWLNLFPRPKPFVRNGGGYVTLSFIPTLGTMLLGLFAGRILRSETAPVRKLGWFVLLGLGLTALGWGLGEVGICPVVKRIWTPSWVLFSGGLCYLFLAGFYLLADLWKLRAAFVWLMVVGANSIAAYLIAHLFVRFIRDAWLRHLGRGVFESAGAAYEPLLLGIAILGTEWALLWWMHRRKIFLRV